MRSSHRVLSLVSFVGSFTRASAQTHTFNWGINVNLTGTQLQECQSLPIIVLPLDGNSAHTGVPPYYMIAFEVDGVPTTTNIGSDPTKLSWKNTHKKGSNLMLAVIDSNTTGSGIGGVDTPLYSVTAGSDSSCLSSQPAKSKLATVSPNITDTLATCEEWGLAITGGLKPYTVVLSALNAPVITNITMGAKDDFLSYPNRADPGAQLMASVVDANGNWGVSTAAVQTTGSSNVDCGSLLPSSSQQGSDSSQGPSTSSSPHASKTPTKNAANQSSNSGLALGVGLGVGIPVLLGLLAGVYFCVRRRNRREQGIWDPHDAPTPTPYNPHNSDMREADAAGQFPSPAPFKHSVYSVPDSPSSTPFMQATPVPPVYLDEEPRSSFASGPPGSSSNADLSTRAAGTRDRGPESTAYRRKAREAMRDQAHPSSPGMDSPVTLLPPSSTVDPSLQAQHGIIIQHVDGGSGPGVVQELPPPYVDRSQPTSAFSRSDFGSSPS